MITHMYCDARYDIPKSNTEALHRNRKAWQRAIARELTKRDKKIKVTKRCFGCAQHDKVGEGANGIVIPSPDSIGIDYVEESHYKSDEGTKRCFDEFNVTNNLN
ncbi:MAG TPA: hypothetical protein PLA63_11505 [Tenuifilum sp.]|nr:hypothetical protein [Tenuifilum sp.]